MAIKERKQITGTTAQINGFAGHEGVLAFDKDTKHLHVLSGRAGQSTKIANVGDIPNVSGLATKKELNGYFPKSGAAYGESLRVDNDWALKRYNGKNRHLAIMSGDSISESAWLALFGNEYVADSRTGCFVLSSGSNALIGEPNGTLSWMNMNMECINSQGTNWIRYNSGVQICWSAYVQITGSNTKHTYPVSFSVAPSLAVSLRGDIDNHSMFTIANGETYMDLFTEKATSGSFTYIAIGRWK